MLTITNDIKREKYRDLVSYAFLRCDSFSLRLPHLTGYDLYSERVRPLIERFRPYIIKEYTGTEYFWSTGVEADIYIFSLCEALREELTEAASLFSWQYPEAPEDLCFISNGMCWLASIAHEELCFIYTDSRVEKKILRKVIGVKYTERRDVATPSLKTADVGQYGTSF